MEAKAALTAALKDLGRRHLWQEVFSQFEYFRRQHGDPGAAACAALTGACGRARRWELALDLLEEARRSRLSCDGAARNAAIGACEWPLALHFLQQAALGPTSEAPTSVTYNSVVASCERGAAW
ncbi:unnamed protein product, partial [Polarella glacialis]